MAALRTYLGVATSNEVLDCLDVDMRRVGLPYIGPPERSAIPLGSEGVDFWGCRIRKVEPMRRYFASAGIDAWVAGLRRGQGVTRSEAAKIEIDETHGGIVKVNPLVDWSHEQVWVYVSDQNVSVYRLHKQG